jgi:hypothetical protein
VNAGLDENEPELGVLVLSVPFQMLADGDGLLDQIVQVLWELRGQAHGLHEPHDFVACDEAHLGDAVHIPEDNTWNLEISLKLCIPTFKHRSYRSERVSGPSCPAS